MRSYLKQLSELDRERELTKEFDGKVRWVSVVRRSQAAEQLPQEKHGTDQLQGLLVEGVERSHSQTEEGRRRDGGLRPGPRQQRRRASPLGQRLRSHRARESQNRAKHQKECRVHLAEY